MKYKQNKYSFEIEANSIKDDGEGVITFSKGLTITDTSEQRNGTKYDIKSMDVSEYDGILTADHGWNIDKIIGKTFGLEKHSNKITIEGIRFAVNENPLAIFAYNMIKGGFLKDFSIETYGPWPDDDGVYHDAKLVGLSAVVTGNNKSASINQITLNSIEQAKKAGMDTSLIEKQYLGIDKEENNIDNDIDMKFVTIKNNRKFAVKLNYKNANGDEVEQEVAPGATVDVSEDQKSDVEAQVKDAEAPKDEETPEQKKAREEKEAAAAGTENKLTDDVIKNALAPLTKQIEDLKEQIFDNSAQEPQFRAAKTSNGAVKYSDMSYKDRHGKQINYAWEALKGGNAEAQKHLNEINEVNLEALKKENIVENSITIADMGNFVISPELLRDIEGVRSDFQPLLSKLNFRETLSLQMAWLTRNGDINMQEVEMCDDGADGNLKPISEYDAAIRTSNLHELAAVTPVCNAATRFLAVDLLADVAAGYRTDYDRKRAQLFIARLQQAVNSSGNTTILNTSTGALNPLNSIIDGAAQVAESVESGTWIFNTSTYYQLLKYRMAAGASQDGGFDLFTTGQNPSFLGRPYIVVPNELMPTLNTAQTKVFVVEGVSVTINQGMFYVDLNTFSGRTSGGLNYDLSTEAAYEVGNDVRSAFQRNELVLRGSFFRGGAVRDIEKVAGVGAPGVS